MKQQRRAPTKKSFLCDFSFFFWPFFLMRSVGRIEPSPSCRQWCRRDTQRALQRFHCTSNNISSDPTRRWPLNTDTTATRGGDGDPNGLPHCREGTSPCDGWWLRSSCGSCCSLRWLRRGRDSGCWGRRRRLYGWFRGDGWWWCRGQRNHTRSVHQRQACFGVNYRRWRRRRYSHWWCRGLRLRSSSSSIHCLCRTLRGCQCHSGANTKLLLLLFRDSRWGPLPCQRLR